MTVYNLLRKIYIDGNTAVVAEGKRGLLKNGIKILNESGESFEILSVGIDKPIDSKLIYEKEWNNKTSLLISGIFTSDFFYI